jgi:hypothetical protein
MVPDCAEDEQDNAKDLFLFPKLPERYGVGAVRLTLNSGLQTDSGKRHRRPWRASLFPIGELA